MTTASPKETLEEPQEPEGTFAKIGDMIEDVLDDLGEKLTGKKPEDPKHPKDDPKPDPCCGPPNVG